tara:strand:- start:1137 stop:1580 length:444 start_codon:yes stop_codon:yes gene_type:complete
MLVQAYQDKLIEIGEALGYETRRSYKKSAAGDAVWLDRRGGRIWTESLPVVAFKLLTFETTKEIREAIATLQAISPSLGVLVVIEEAYAERGRLLKRFDTETYPDHIRQIARGLAEGIGLAFRVDVWTDKEVNALYQKEVEGRLRFA